MDSKINHQPDGHQQDLTGAYAVDKIKELVSQSDTCFFCTEVAVANSVGARPMAVQEVDDYGNMWFLSADNSHKNEELMRNPRIRLYFQGSSHSDFLLLDGTASASHDKQRIKELWKPLMKNWFAGGEEDPRITVIKFVPSTGYYWDTKHNMAIAGVKMLIGAATGRTMDDSVEGKLQV